jgi:hypothetical protein
LFSRRRVLLDFHTCLYAYVELTLSLHSRPPLYGPHSSQSDINFNLNHAPQEVSMAIDSSDRFIATELIGDIKNIAEKDDDEEDGEY